MRNFIFKDFSNFVHLQGLETVANLLAMGSFSAHIIVFKYHFQLKGTLDLCRNVWIQVWGGWCIRQA